MNPEEDTLAPYMRAHAIHGEVVGFGALSVHAEFAALTNPLQWNDQDSRRERHERTESFCRSPKLLQNCSDRVARFGFTVVLPNRNPCIGPMPS